MHDLPGGLVEAEHGAVPASGVDEVGIGGVGSDVAELESSRRGPVAIGDLAVVTAAGDSGSAAILLRAVNVIRKMLIGAHMIKLPGRLVVPGTPGVAGVHASGRALVDSDNHMLRVRRIDPENVIVISTGRARPGFERPSAVFGAVHGSLCYVDEVRILGIDKHSAEVAIPENARIGCTALPTASAIF